MQQTVRFKGTPAQLLDAVAKAVKKASRNRKVLDAVGKKILNIVHSAFIAKEDGGTDAAGLRWKPLAKATIRRKVFDRILIDSGSLEKSLLPDVTRPRYQVFRIKRNTAEVGTRRPFALAQHLGIPGRLPQRKLWAAIRDWPHLWWRELLLVATKEVANVIVNELK